MTTPQFGALIGVLLGIAWAVSGFGDMLVVGVVFGGIGYLVARAVAGDLDFDLQDYIGRNKRR